MSVLHFTWPSSEMLKMFHIFTQFFCHVTLLWNKWGVEITQSCETELTIRLFLGCPETNTADAVVFTVYLGSTSVSTSPNFLPAGVLSIITGVIKVSNSLRMYGGVGPLSTETFYQNNRTAWLVARMSILLKLFYTRWEHNRECSFIVILSEKRKHSKLHMHI